MWTNTAVMLLGLACLFSGINLGMILIALATKRTNRLEFQYEKETEHSDGCANWANPSSVGAGVSTDLKDSPVPGGKDKTIN